MCTELYLFVLSTIFNSNSILYFTLYNILGSFSNDDGDGNKDVKKAIGLY